MNLLDQIDNLLKDADDCIINEQWITANLKLNEEQHIRLGNAIVNHHDISVGLSLLVELAREAMELAEFYSDDDGSMWFKEDSSIQTKDFKVIEYKSTGKAQVDRGRKAKQFKERWKERLDG